MRLGIGSWILVVGLLIACQPMDKAKEEIPDLPPIRPVLNFSGDTLQAKTFPDSTCQVLLGNMLAAKAQAEQYPDSSELAIWYGRRMAYMGRYHEAIDIFSDAINRFPNDHRLLRHRGHRYITTRQLDKAITDFERTAELCVNEPNAIEPDGIPNKLNKPLGNDKFNIFYHQGLVYYLNGEFAKALEAYKKCMGVSDNDDLRVATSYWMYMSLIRSGDLEKAQKFLQDTETDLVELIENDVYLELLQVFKGEKTGEEILTMPGHPTYQYGIGFYHWSNGNEEMARSVWKKALVQDSWDSFGYIAAEAELTNLRNDRIGLRNSDFEINSILVIVAPLNQECRFDMACDCCYELLDFKDGRFINRVPCVSDMTTFTGIYSLDSNHVNLIYDQLGLVESFDDYEGDTTYLINSDLEFRSFELTKCNSSTVLTEDLGDTIAYGVLNYLGGISAPLDSLDFVKK